ncbi:Kinesin-like protein kif3a [Phytophthora pseudosyringae]|uniref:Kinesin-like protein n=1 Tax=Phytophthora pseudosyringae TaxID=221518 RepID=A0A8T1VWM0_9STRA|nr:Kinesin-like protein kif3a [Phytophthora pseudosyringae]
MATKSSKSDECVRVMVRIRPMSSKEVQDGRREVTTANFDRAEVSINNPVAASSEPPKSFTFDAAFGARSTQQQVYDTAATEIVEAVMEGYNGTIFAYGQTGAGKSHTMEGYGDQPGIIPYSFKHVFDKVAISKNKRILVRASYLEIYNEEIRDLLSKDPKNALDLKENADSGVYVKGLTAQVVKDAAEIDHVMQTGKKNRSVGATLMNQTSSRSHSIFTIVVECLSEGSAGDDGKDHVCVGKLNLVDLAGSERQSKTGATGDRLQEANKINLSLSALGNVISALVDGKSKHIPYRDSKLTRLLQDSLGGNTKTVMIANCGPADYNYEETLTTLRYASRAKNIKNKPKINEDPKDAMIREFQEEIEALKAKLLAIDKQASEGVSSVDGGAGGADGPAASAAPVEIVEVEKIVEKIVIEKGISIEEAQAIAEKAQREKEEMMQKTRDDLALAAKDKAQVELNKRELELKLERERQQAEELAAQQKVLLDRLAATQAKVLVGGEMMTKAAQQEDELRRTKLELEERKRQELQLARELAEQEESNLMREEKYQSLQEEAEAKARKLKKVYTKVKEVLGDIKAMEKAHSREHEDLLDTIRQLTAQLKLKTLVLDYFVPPEAVGMLEARARWNDEEDDFTLDRLELAGNTLRPRQRPPSASSVRRPETSSSDKSRAAKKFAMAPQNDDEDDEIARAEELELARNPFFMYVSDNEGDGYAPAASRKKQPASSSGSGSSRPKTAKKSSAKSSSKRPETASSKRRSEK